MFAVSLRLRPFWFVLTALVSAPWASAQVYVSRFANVSIAQTTVAAGDTLTVSYTLAAGSVAPTRAFIGFRSAEGYGRTLITTDPASGTLTLPIAADMPNGTYKIDYAEVDDSNGRSWYYFASDGGLVPTRLGVLPAPGPTFDFKTVSFTVTGGLATVTPAKLLSLTRTSADILPAGGAIAFNLSSQAGSSPLTQILLELRSPDNQTVTVRSEDPTATTLRLTTNASWLNGTYTVQRISLVDANGSSIVTRGDSLLPASLDFTLSGGLTTAKYPQFTSLARDGSGPMTAGAALKMNFTADGTPPFSYVFFSYVDVTGQPMPRAAMTVTDGHWELATGPDWVNGHYRLDSVQVGDALHGPTTYFRNGLVATWGGPNLAPLFKIDFEALDFDLVGGFAIKPYIVTQPASATLKPGETHDLSVVAGTFPALVRFEWYVGESGDTSHPLAGYGNTSLVRIEPLSSTTSYWVRVVTAEGSIDSQTATLTIDYPSLNPAIVSQPQIWYDNGTTYTTGIRAHVLAVGPPPLSYQWFKDGVAIPGATSTEFKLSPVHYTDSGDYTVQVSNPNGSVISAVARADVHELPVIVLQPADQAGVIGGSVTFTAKAVGGGLSYGWSLNGSSPVPNSTTSAEGTLTITNLQFYHAGTYTLYVRNNVGYVAATPVKLTLTGGPLATLQIEPVTYGEINRPLGIDTRASTYVLEYGATGLPPGMTIDPIQGGIFGTSTAAGTYSATITAKNYGGTTSTPISIVISAVPFAPIIVHAPQSQTAALHTHVTLSVAAAGTPGGLDQLYYQWFLNGAPILNAVAPTYTINSVAATDDGDYAVEIYGSAGTTRSPAAHLTVDVNASAPYVIDWPRDRIINLGQPTTFTAMVGGTAPITYRWRKETGVNAGTYLESSGPSYTIAHVTLADAGDYSVEATNAYGTITVASARLGVVNPPAILTQPQSQTITAGATATLRVVADASAVSYQWYEGTSGDITLPVSGAASATFVTPPLTHTARYWVRVNNAYGWSAFSAAATVTLDPLPPGPASTTTRIGGTASFSAAPGTASAPTFQWSRNGTSITSATDATLTIATVRPEDAGVYTVAITSAGTTVTQSAILSLESQQKLVGSAAEVGSDIVHPNHNIYDQMLLGGTAAAITADPGQVVRTSFVDLNGDIVQVEFAGAGTLTITLENATGPAPAAFYDQPTVAYMQGHATLVVTGADASTNLSVFSVGRATAINQSLFRSDVIYDGVADIAAIAISSRDGHFGGLRTANAGYFNTHGMTGVYAPGVQFDGPVYIGEITATDAATPTLMIGAGSDVRITGGSLDQPNGHAIEVSGFTHLQFTAGTDSHGNEQPAKAIAGRLERDGQDVTKQLTDTNSP